MEELFWDVFLVLEKDGIELNLWAYLSRIRRLSFLLLNYQAFADKNHICFHILQLRASWHLPIEK